MSTGDKIGALFTVCMFALCLMCVGTLLDMGLGEYSSPRSVAIVARHHTPEHTEQYSKYRPSMNGTPVYQGKGTRVVPASYSVTISVGDDQVTVKIGHGLYTQLSKQESAVLWEITGGITGISYSTNHLTAPTEPIPVEGSL